MQKGFKVFSNVEQLLFEACSGKPHHEEMGINDRLTSDRLSPQLIDMPKLILQQMSKRHVLS